MVLCLTGCAAGRVEHDARDATPTDAGDADAPTDAAAGLDAAHDAGDWAADAFVTDANLDAGTDAGAPVDTTIAWVLSYFGPAQDLPNDSLHLAYSVDGLHWTALSPAHPVFQLSGIGTNHIRDPFILRKQDGTFTYLATDWTLAENDASYWSHPSPYIVVADSTDLITFTNARRLRVTSLAGPSGSDMHAWAPEAYFDASRGQYAILWSGNDTSDVNRIYASYTSDFATVGNPTPDVFFAPGYSVIDGTLAREGADWYLIFKDATGAGQDVQIARSASMDPGSFVRWDPAYIVRGASQSTQQVTEGPFALFAPSLGDFVMFADYYAQGGVFGAWTSSRLDASPASWTKLASTQYRFPPGVRHANTVRVTQPELDALIAHYGVEHRLRTGYVEGGKPFYVAHSWFHGVVARLDEPSLAAGDNAWHFAAGLSDGNDPALVSFEALGFPGRFLRADSANPTRYPPCGEASTYGWALCNVPATERVDLIWLDTFVDTTTFRADATFRRVPALNGDASMVSYQWIADPTRYLRHATYQLFVSTVDGSTEQTNAASFTVE